jgi:hypothetical protein
MKATTLVVQTAAETVDQPSHYCDPCIKAKLLEGQYISECLEQRGKPGRSHAPDCQSNCAKVAHALDQALQRRRVHIETKKLAYRLHKVEPSRGRWVSGSHEKMKIGLIDGAEIRDLDQHRTVWAIQEPQVSIRLPKINTIRRSALQYAHGRFEMKWSFGHEPRTRSYSVASLMSHAALRRGKSRGETRLA